MDVQSVERFDREPWQPDAADDVRERIAACVSRREDAEAVALASAAAKRRITLGDHRSALEFVETAAAIAAAPTPLDVMLLRGKALTIAGRVGEAFEALERVSREAASDDPERAADALDWLSWLAWIELDGERARTYDDRLETLAVPNSSAEAFRSFLRRATSTLQFGDARAALALLLRAENVSELADIGSFVSYLAIKGDVHGALGDAALHVHHAKLAFDICRSRADRYVLLRATIYYGYALQSSGHVSQSRAIYEEGLALAEALQLTWEGPFCASRAAWAAYLTGDLESATRLVARAFRSSATHRWMYATRSWVGLSIALATDDADLRGRAADDVVPALVLRSCDDYSVGPAIATYVDYYLRTGRSDDAGDLLAAGIRRLSSPDCAWMLLPLVATYGDPDDVAHATRLLERFPAEHPVAAAHRLLFASRLAARAGESAKAERLAGEAQYFFERIEWTYAAVRCIELSGRIGEARRRFETMGASYEARRLADLRARPGRPRRGYERSRQRTLILDLLAHGATNQIVADRLGVSRRTIKNRIRELYDAEGVANREELLRRHGHKGVGRADSEATDGADATGL